jgi:8-oxo-dGTP pyrophosphatase MutT (NUDIX family)
MAPRHYIVSWCILVFASSVTTAWNFNWRSSSIRCATNRNYPYYRHFCETAISSELATITPIIASTTIMAEDPNRTVPVLETIMFPESILTYDHYNGVTVHLDHIHHDDFSLNAAAVQARLGNALAEWTKQGRKGIWIHLRNNQSELVPVVCNHGFQFHMVQQSSAVNCNSNILVLSKWLLSNTNTPSRLPRGPTHQVGVGCVVWNPLDATQLLVVQEQSGPAAALNLWKLPTGLADPGEDVHAAALREFKEETGIALVAFDGILAVRQVHPFVGTQRRCGTSTPTTTPRSVSDLFFVCQLRLLDDINTDVTTFQPCPDEIAGLQWMSASEYCAQDAWQSSPAHVALNQAICAAQSEQSQSEQWLLRAHVLDGGLDRGVQAVYMSGDSSREETDA